MTPAQWIKKHSPEWDQLETLLSDASVKHGRTPDRLRKVAELYRSVCTDLSLASVYRLPQQTTERIERLVSRSHTFLYSKGREPLNLKTLIFKDIPRLVFTDRFAWGCVLLFYFVFFVSGIIGYYNRPFAASAVGEATLQQYIEMHAGERDEQTASGALAGTGFYVANNVSLCLLTYGIGILGGIGSLYMILFNGIHLGAVIGVLLNSPAREGILSWIFAHAPFELTAIGLSAGAGLRTGLAFVNPGGRRRLYAMAEEAKRSVPAIVSAAVLMFMAAGIEAFIAPLNVSLALKVGIGLTCILIMIVYFVVLGYRASRWT